MTEKELRNKVVATAQKYLGCKESNGTHKKIIDLYNSHKPLARGHKVKYTEEWCATFASAVGIECGLTDIMPTECSCSKLIELYTKLGRWMETDSYVPSPADLLIYDWEDSGKGENKGQPNHIGIVVSVTGNTIKIIEGNKNEAVAYRAIAVNGKYIRGFCTPNFASKATAEEEEEMVYYKTIKDVPKEYKAAVQKAIDAGALAGYGGGVLNVSEDLCRTLTILDRLGQLEKIK